MKKATLKQIGNLLYPFDDGQRVAKTRIFHQFLCIGVVFGQLAWAWLKMSFATYRAYFPTYRNLVMFDLNYLFQSFSRRH